jgi:hypothetical protein
MVFFATYGFHTGSVGGQRNGVVLASRSAAAFATFPPILRWGRGWRPSTFVAAQRQGLGIAWLSTRALPINAGKMTGGSSGRTLGL